MIAVAQIAPLTGQVAVNLGQHWAAARVAASRGVGFLLFPELSLTGYEPSLAGDLAMESSDARLDEFEAFCRSQGVLVGLGMPLKADSGVQIGMLVLGGAKRVSYAKQHLHPDEEPFFMPGQGSVLVQVGESVVAPAICYESLLMPHVLQATEAGANLYAASVAKHAYGVERAQAHYQEIARSLGVMVVMANCVGPCDNFVASGRSCLVDGCGLMAQLEGESAVLGWDGTCCWQEEVSIPGDSWGCE